LKNGNEAKRRFLERLEVKSRERKLKTENEKNEGSPTKGKRTSSLLVDEYDRRTIVRKKKFLQRKALPKQFYSH